MDLSVASAPPGATFNIVVHVIKREHGITTCEGLSPRQVFTVFGAPDDLDGKYTIYDLVLAQDEVHDCFFGKDTLAVAHPPKDQFARVTLMDLCSGMGGFSIGSQLLGMRTCAFVERSSLACAALRANFSCPVIQGELGATDTLKQLHALKGTDHLQVTGGFPCQGFSRQGDLCGMDDHRLCFILDAAWFLQADDILLDCVANVVNFASVQSLIDDYAARAGMNVHKLTFDLKDQWPVRRDRFWCHLTCKTLPNVTIPRWPTTQDFRCLKDIMPLDACWDADSEHQLTWDPSELALYLDPCFGRDQRVLGPDDQAPTVLHSWGHVNRPCPCGCRQAFSLARLRQGGARGFGLISAVTGQHRHLHHQEGAMLCTVPPTFHFPMPPRAALSLLGQIAAPLQVLWIQAHILAGYQLHHWGYTNIDPELAIKAFQCGLKAFAFNRWITSSHSLPRDIQLYVEGTNKFHHIKIDSPTTVAQLITAEKNLAGWGHYIVVTQDGHRLHPQDLLQPGVSYCIHIQLSKQARPYPLERPLTGGVMAIKRCNWETVCFGLSCRP